MNLTSTPHPSEGLFREFIWSEAVFFVSSQSESKHLNGAVNNKEFISEMASRLGYTQKEAQDRAAWAIEALTQELQEGHAVSVVGFGLFDVKKKLERIAVNPATGQRMLVPPKLVLTYKPSANLRDELK